MGSDEYVPPSNTVSRAGTGVVGGLAGGVLAGIVLQVTGGMRTVSELVGNSAVSVTWMVVLVSCAFAGGVYGALLGRWVSGLLVPAIGIGMVFGALCWVLLGLLAVPLRRGGQMFVIDDRAMLDLLGYVAFGVIVGVVYAVAGPRRRYHYGGEGRRSWATVYAVPRPRRRRRS